ncbi:MAG: hypothetical protein M3162_04850 [Thermoproteota archaeon]|nr:hypothetical protein [Thermoproteota archaeon]
MPRIIPPSIKIDVIRDYLKAVPRDKIAQDNGIGEGTVSSIVQRMKSEIPDIYTLRNVAVMISRQVFNLAGLVSTTRLKKTLERLELPEEKVEEFLEKIFVYCYKNNIEVHVFTSKINEILQISKGLDIPITSIPGFIKEKKEKMNYLDQQIKNKEQQFQSLYKEYGIDRRELQEYRLRQPMYGKTIAAEAKAREKDEENRELRKQIVKLGQQITIKDSIIHDLQKKIENNQSK